MAIYVYYAHPMSLYDKPIEALDIETLERLGYTVLNPNKPEIQAFCQRLKTEGLADQIMEQVFKPKVIACDLLAFRAFPDGSISAGVALEIVYAKSVGMPIIELPTGIVRRTLSIEETREMLVESGQR